MHERLRFLRDDLALSQSAFGERLGVSRDVVNNLERGRVEIKDHIVKLICVEYSVNERWLRDGIGSMYVEPDAFSLDDFVKNRGADDTELTIIKAYFELDRDVRQMLISHFKNRLFGSGNVIYDDIPDTPETLERRFGATEEEKSSGAG